MKQLMRYPVVAGLVAANFLYMIAHHALPATWSYYVIERFSWSERDIGWSLGAVGVCMMIVQGYLIRIVIPKYGEERTAYFGLACTVLSFVGYAISPFGWLIYVFIVLGAGMGFVGPAVNGLMSARIPANEQGELQGAIGSVASLASILSPPLMTQLFSVFSDGTGVYFPGASLMAAAVLTLISMVFFARVLAHAKSAREA